MHGELAFLAIAALGVVAGTVAYVRGRLWSLRDRLLEALHRYRG